MFDDDGVVAFGLVTGVLLIMDDLPLFVIAIDDGNCEPHSAFIFSGPQDAELRLESLLRVKILCRGKVQPGSTSNRLGLVPEECS